ncbi:Fic/DOC family protein [Mycolicibacterium llatzerense]|uniref:Fic/DOC family protein n=1 Tax=Mycolicibacterium llatzerense TaxID=280871 RepID=UPI0008DE55BD|nr:Fic/DOC family protein [Mycolicibacterium llatzerense]
MAHPWDTGDPDRNWQGYFIPGSRVLRNRIGATTHAELQDAENDLVEARVVELRENPGLLTRSYDLLLLQAIHRYLFQDVYLWAGEARTVGIEKGDESFCPPGSIHQPMDHVAAEIHHLKRLVAVADTDLPRTVAYLYDYVNFAHPFREGNGRATREFFNLLIAERGNGLDWNQTDITELHSACHTARADGDLTGLTRMFAKILDTDPAYDL